MDVVECSTLIEYLQQVPDPRAARGRRHQWWVILAIVAAAHLAGQRGFRAIAQWASDHQGTLDAYLPLWHHRVPSRCTLQRALWYIDVEALERLISQFLLAQAGGDCEAVALDGKALRGCLAHGVPQHLVALVTHGRPLVLRQTLVDDKSNEITAAPRLLDGFDVSGLVLTADALHCQRSLSADLVGRGGHYLLAVKDNQPTLREDLEYFFQAPRHGPHPSSIARHANVGKGHGRGEERLLEASSDLRGYLDWPGLEQVIHRVCRRRRNGKVTEEHHYFITSLPVDQASPRRLEDLCRGHWGIENKVHYPRDVTFGEDASNIRTGAAPQAMAAFRNLALALFHLAGFVLASDASRYFQAKPQKALQALGLRRL